MDGRRRRLPGGLIGLGGAEFRLPLLLGAFGCRIRQAITINLAVSLVTVVAALPLRTVAVGAGALRGLLPVMVALAAGGIVGAFVGATWVARLSDLHLGLAVRALLVAVGVLLVVESLVSWSSSGLATGEITRALAGVGAGVVIGAFSSVLGVAGGELIIPTLVFGFGAGIKLAGTASLCVSIPGIVVGLSRQAQAGLLPSRGTIQTLVLPMSAGSVVGALLGGALRPWVPSTALKALLGLVLIWSALRMHAEVAGAPAASREWPHRAE